MSKQFEQKHGPVSTRSADDIANLSTTVKRISKSPSGRLTVLIEVTNNSANEVALVRLDGMLSYKSDPLTTCSGTLRTGTIRPSESGLAFVDCRYEYPDIAVDELEADIYVEELSYVQKNG